jgi:hypothetical protein
VRVGNLAWSPFGFSGDIDYGLRFGHPARLAKREAGRLALLARSLLAADVIHAHFGQSLTSLRAFPIATAERNSLIEALTVALARRLWFPWTHLAIDAVGGPLAERDPFKQALVAELVSNNVKIFAVNPDLMDVLPPTAQFLPYGHLDIRGVAMRNPDIGGGTLRFLHMPTDRRVKGTQHFLDAVCQLQREGIDCSLTIMEDRDNATAQSALLAHDVLLDQLHVGWYGAVAVEAMAAGLPVIAHLVDADRSRIPHEMDRDLPILVANPSSIADVMRQVARMNPAARNAIGAASRRFAETWHDPNTVARTVIDAYGRPVATQLRQA